MKQRITHYKKLRGEEDVAVDKSIYRKQMKAIRENANSDRPIWDVKFPTNDQKSTWKDKFYQMGDFQFL